MLTTDFSGTYDFEKTEAIIAADHICDDLHDGYNDYEQHLEAITKTLVHWKKYLTPEGFDDFSKHFHARIAERLNP